MEKEWYVVNTYSGHENKVKEKLELKASSQGMEDSILRIVVPEQVEVELKDGERKEKRKKMFPGYILVEMVMTDEAWYAVRNTPGVTGFIGSSGRGTKPFPLTPVEVDKILGSIGMSRMDIVKDLEPGDAVKIVAGAFADMNGKVKTIDYENNRVEVIIDLFGQETPVEVELIEIQKG